jgi:hypothetical protein
MADLAGLGLYFLGENLILKELGRIIHSICDIVNKGLFVDVGREIVLTKHSIYCIIFSQFK